MTTPNDPSQPPSEGPPPAGPQGFQPPPGAQQQPPPGYQPPPSYSTPQGFPAAPPVQPQYGYGQVSAPPGMYGDATSGLALPNGTQLAPVGRRVGAWFLSILLVIVTLGIGYLIWGLILWGRGQTPSLKVLGMRVWRPDDQRPATWGEMFLREFVGRFLLGLIPAEQLVSFVVFLVHKQHRAIHDIVGSTVVLHDPNKVIPGA